MRSFSMILQISIQLTEEQVDDAAKDNRQRGFTSLMNGKK